MPFPLIASTFWEYLLLIWFELIFLQSTALYATRYFVANNDNDAANSGTILLKILPTRRLLLMVVRNEIVFC